jgi:amidase
MTEETPRPAFDLTRRDALKLAAMAGAGASLAALGGVETAAAASAPTDLNEATVAQLQASMKARRLSSGELVEFYLARIRALDKSGPIVNSVIELNPDAKAIAAGLDAERRSKGPRGPLHGIPVLLKDNVDTHDKMQTAAGSLALVGTPALQDSTAVAKLRAAGAVILGKTNLSEWANFRGNSSSSGWSGRGGQCNNPYAIDRNPCGSSSGSGAATSANFTAVSIGSETDGSIVCPANNNGVVGIKPTVGLISRAGVVPISHTQDTLGPHARTVADAAALLEVLASTGFDGRDPATGGVPLGRRGISTRPAINTNYTASLNPNGLNGAKIGVAREFEGFSLKADAVFEKVLAQMSAAGAQLFDITFPHFGEINSGAAEITVLLYDFKKDLNDYLKTRSGVPIHSLADAIAFNNAHFDKELRFFGQELFIQADALDLNDPATIAAYNAALDTDQKIGATEGIDAILKLHGGLDAIVAPTGSPAWPTDLINGDHFILGTSSPCAIVGYPVINVPSGMSFGVPVGISFMGTAFSEHTLIRLASGFEHVVNARRVPKFLDTLPFGTPGATGEGEDPGHGKGKDRQRVMQPMI